MDVNYDNNATGISVVIVSAAMYFARTLFRRGAKDMSEIKTEMSQNSYVETLRADNEQLRREIAVIAKERNDALSKMGALEARLEIMQKQCEEKAVVLELCPVLKRSRELDHG
jgi:hypothetical protein